MTRAFDSAFAAALETTGPVPILLLELATGIAAPDDFIRYSLYDESVTWNSKTWTPYPFDVGEIKIDQERQSLDLPFADADGTMGTWLLSTDFHGRRLTVYLVEKTQLGSASKCRRDDFKVSHYEWVRGALKLTCRNLLAPIEAAVPARVFLYQDFPGMSRTEIQVG